MAKKSQIPVEDVNDIVTDVNIGELIPNVIDNILVTMFENYHTVVLPLNVNDIMFRVWQKGRGGVFSKDVTQYSKGKTTSKYVLIKGASLNCVARLVSEQEELTFTALKLIDGKIKDRPYMILKHLSEGEKLNSSVSSGDLSFGHEEAGIMYASIQHPDEDFEAHAGSISLFSE